MTDWTILQAIEFIVVLPFTVALGFLLGFIAFGILMWTLEGLSWTIGKLFPLVLLLVLVASTAHAASLKVCFKPATSPDAVATRIYAGTTALVPDAAPGDSTMPQLCVTYPAPATRGTPIDYTAKFVNAFGEEGPASNAITFRAPTVPPAPALLSVGGTATP